MKKNNEIYFRVIVITLALIIANQLFIQFWLYQKRSDAQIINVAGKQRMLSQRLVNIYTASLNPQSVVKLESLYSLYETWNGAHQDLIQRHSPSWVSFPVTKEIHQDLLNLSPLIEKSQVLISNQEHSESHLENLRIHQDDFLKKMNAVVSKIEALSTWKLNVVVWIEILFAIFSLFMVYYEINFVFRRINQNLTDKNLALEESNEMLEQYAYLAAHDLRSPLQNIVNFSGLLEEELDERLSPDEKSYIEYITDSAERMQDTTENLLQFSSINNEQLQLTQFDPSEVLAGVIEDLTVQIEEKQAKIQIKSLPRSLVADKNLIYLVFQNLIGNGIKFVEANTIPHLDISYEEDSSYHIFHFADNGIGIKEDQQEKIFKIFKRLHSQEDFKGTGIGLSICKKIIEKHKGYISVSSNFSAGSTFSVKISKTLKENR